MRVLLQRVMKASVSVDGACIGRIGKGVLLFVGFTHEDSDAVLEKAASKIANLRIFADENDRLNHSLIEQGGAVLLVPQFTLYASTNRGRRPDFVQAMKPDSASQLFDQTVEVFRRIIPLQVETGCFGADMKVSLVNDGPFTLSMEF